MMIEEDILPRELTNNIPRRGKWTAEEERYTEKIICKKSLAMSLQACQLCCADTHMNPHGFSLSGDFEHGTLDVPGECLTTSPFVSYR